LGISRQRFFGVPFPLWYRVDERGEPDHDAPIVPDESQLPIDPLADVPDGFTADQRDQPGGFTGDPDIMDTWATSSLTPQISGGWEDDPDLFARVFPMDVRPQAHEIIRTWLFYTVLKSQLEHGSLPWTNVAISGWVLDPDRKKMSKSKGNVVTPLGLLEAHGSDAVRYWAASARLGADATFDEQQMKVGRKLAIKILNASKFTLGMVAKPGEITEPLDRSMLAALARVVEQATDAFAAYDHARALELTERFFWAFTDDYLELVKQRAYGGHGETGAGSAVGALRLALDAMLRLFAPFLPYVTEEVWSWWRTGSIHRAPWPAPDALTGDAQTDTAIYEFGAEILTAVRKEKALRKVSLRAPVEVVTVRDTSERLALLAHIEGDLTEAGNVERIEREVADAPSVTTVLASVEP
jgi:valyl-tRNA synthetase